MRGEPHTSWLEEYLTQRAAWSVQTFGEGRRTGMVVGHIRKELEEIEDNPTDLAEWTDVLVIAFDGYMRAGGAPGQIREHFEANFEKVLGREWPPISDADAPVEHIRTPEEQARKAAELESRR